MSADKDASALLRGAALTSALIYKQTHDAVGNAIGELNRIGVTPALLKGISVAEQYYQPPSARIMGDVDLLVPAEDAAAAQAMLQQMGYRELDSEAPGDSHHHLPAMRHPDTGVILELHTALYSARSGPAAFSPIDEAQWREHWVDDQLSGHDVYRLGADYQLAYTLMHWAAEHKWADGVFGILDFQLIAANDTSLDWLLFGQWMKQNDAFGACAAIMFTYLERNRLLAIPEGIVESVNSSSQQFGPGNLKFACFLVDSYPMNTRKATLSVGDKRAARAAWRSLLDHSDARPSSRRALLASAKNRSERITLNPLRFARRLKSKFS